MMFDPTGSRTLILVVAVCLLSGGCRPAGSLSKAPAPAAAETPLKAAAIAPAEESPPPVAREPAADDWFEDVTQRSGVDFTYHNGREGEQYTILETVGGGVAMLDYDNDDDLDLYFPGGGSIDSKTVAISGRPGALYRNDGDWRFTDVTAEAGLAAAAGYTHGSAAVDFDRDGFCDLFVTGYRCGRLYRNDGRGHFEDVSEKLGLALDGWSTAAAWTDLDRDGWPELFVVNYLDWRPAGSEFCGLPDGSVRDVCPPQIYPCVSDQLFRNREGRGFEERTDEAGIRRADRGLGVVAADFNDDGWIDFYVANDVMPNRLYLGRGDLRFEERGAESGTAANEYGAPEGSMGVDFGDYNGDGRGDLWVVNFEMEDNSLYRNDGDDWFTHATVLAGLAGRCRPLTGFGTGFADFDSDGWLDLYVINGNVYYSTGQSPYRQPAVLFRNLAGRRFADASESAGPYFSVPHAGRGAAVGDLDNDGALDLVVVHQNDPVVLLRNRRPAERWLRVKLQGETCDREAIGARLSFVHDGRPLVRYVRSGAGYLSQSDLRVLYPVAAADVLEVSVVWPGGRREVFRGLSTGKTNLLVEGTGESP